MIRRNKLSIFLVLVVIGLTIYYVRTPEKKPPKTDEPVIATRYPEYAQSRLNILAERNEEIAVCEQEISEASSIDKKNDALERLQRISKLTETEVSLENNIKTIGYTDCLVENKGSQIKVNVLTKTFSVEEFVDIALLIKAEFGNDCQVVVNVDNPA